MLQENINFERGSTSEYNIVIRYQTFAGELSIVN